MVSSESIKPDPDKIRAIIDFAAPRMLKQLRGWLFLLYLFLFLYLLGCLISLFLCMTLGCVLGR
jgi:hypothetical protein